MTDPKRMTEEEQRKVLTIPDDDVVILELSGALFAERAHSAKVEARCEELENKEKARLESIAADLGLSLAAPTEKT